jgi:predicted nucleic acid-binding protein
VIPARELEYRILKCLLDGLGDRWRSFTLPQLAAQVGNSEWAELVDALKRMHAKGYLQLRKWRDYRGFVPYTEKEPDSEFFYRADFQIGITSEARPYFDELQECGTAGRSKITVYLDTNITSRLAKADMTQPVRAALVNIVELFSQGKLDLVTSDLSKKEIDKLNSLPNIDRDKWNLDVVVSLLKKVPFVEDHKLLGFNSYWDRFGGYSNPIIEDDAISAALRGIGLDRTDAHHLMVAIRAECDVFLTLDKRTILNRRTEIEAKFPIRLMDPEEFARVAGLFVIRT